VTCRKCWEIEADCECGAELDEIDASNLRQEGESESQHIERVIGIRSHGDI
jgi:hypothetical protein